MMRSHVRIGSDRADLVFKLPFTTILHEQENFMDLNESKVTCMKICLSHAGGAGSPAKVPLATRLINPDLKVD